MLSLLFVIVQFATLGILFLTGPIFASDPLLLGLELTGIALGFWAIISMGFGNFNITPDVKNGGRLAKAGPYAIIRHPMYAALLVTTLPLLLTSFSVFRLAVWLTLAIDLLLKLNYEEGMLLQDLPGYADYQKESYRLIPFIF